jgi:hypothetical protein
VCEKRNGSYTSTLANSLENRNVENMDDKIKNSLIKLSEIQIERNKSYIDWLKNLLTISTAILAVLISLKSQKISNYIESFFYLSTILLSGIGILCGVIVLFSYVKLENLSLKKQKEQVILLLDKKNIDSFENIELPKFYRVFEYVCYISLFLSLVFLIAYGFVSEI